MSIIRDESPLRHLPALPRKQTLSFDGIGYSVDMAELAYARLRTNLFHLTVTNSSEAEPNNRVAFVSILEDAWSVIDSLHRLIGLLKQTQGLKQNLPYLQVFYRNTLSIKDLRNGVQHLNTEIDKLVDLDLTVWGDVTWVAQPDPGKSELHSGLFAAGTVFGRDSGDFVNPAGKPFNAPIDHITLTAFGHSINLSATMAQVEQMVRSLEASIEVAVEQMPDAIGHPGSGLMVIMVIDFSGRVGGDDS